MNFLKSYSKNLVKYDLINKFNFKTVNSLPDIQFVNLHFNFKKYEVKSLVAALIALELITKQKATFITSKKFNMSLKIQKGDPIGCKITLRRHKMLNFLYQLLNKTELKQTSNKQFSRNNLYSFKITNILVFNNLEKNYIFFKNLKNLHVGIGISSNLKFKTFKFLMRSYKIYI